MSESVGQRPTRGVPCQQILGDWTCHVVYAPKKLTQAVYITIIRNNKGQQRYCLILHHSITMKYPIVYPIKSTGLLVQNPYGYVWKWGIDPSKWLWNGYEMRNWWSFNGFGSMIVKYIISPWYLYNVGLKKNKQINHHSFDGLYNPFMVILGLFIIVSTTSYIYYI